MKGLIFQLSLKFNDQGNVVIEKQYTQDQALRMLKGECPTVQLQEALKYMHDNSQIVEKELNRIFG